METENKIKLRNGEFLKDDKGEDVEAIDFVVEFLMLIASQERSKITKSLYDNFIMRVKLDEITPHECSLIINEMKLRGCKIEVLMGIMEALNWQE